MKCNSFAPAAFTGFLLVLLMLAPEQYAEVVAFILEANAIAPGTIPVSGDFNRLKAVSLPL